MRTSIFLLLLNCSKVDVKLLDENNYSILHYAYKNDQYNVRSYFIKEIMKSGKFSEKERKDAEKEILGDDYQDKMNDLLNA